MKFDWIAIYAVGDPALDNYWAYLHTGGEISGAVVFDAGLIGGELEPGECEVRLTRDHGHVVLATGRFAVTEVLWPVASLMQKNQ